MLQTAMLKPLRILYWVSCDHRLNVIVNGMWPIGLKHPASGRNAGVAKSPLDYWIMSPAHNKQGIGHQKSSGRHAKHFFYILLLNTAQNFFPESLQPTVRGVQNESHNCKMLQKASKLQTWMRDKKAVETENHGKAAHPETCQIRLL